MKSTNPLADPRLYLEGRINQINPLNKNLIRIPKNLDQITQYDPDSEVPSDHAGLSSDCAANIWAATEAFYQTGAMPGISLAIRRQGKLILNRAIGHARGNGPHDPPGTRQVRLTPETPVCLFSASKAMTAMLVHKMAEEGALNLNDTISHHIPEFAAHGKGKITLRDVMTHRAGVPGLIQKEGPDPTLLFDWDRVLREICQARPKAVGKQAYHALTGGYLMGEIMRRATGSDLNSLITEHLAAPLGAQWLSYGVKKNEQRKVALNYMTGRNLPAMGEWVVKRALGGPFAMAVDVSNTPEFMSSIIPAGNIYATALEACNFYQMLLDGGEFNGKRLFEEATVRRATSETPGLSFDRTLFLPLRFSEGFMLGEEPFGLFGPNTSQAFGHLGFLTIFCWADPARDCSVALMTTGKTVLAPHMGALIRLLNTIGTQIPRIRN